MKPKDQYDRAMVCLKRVGLEGAETKKNIRTQWRDEKKGWHSKSNC